MKFLITKGGTRTRRPKGGNRTRRTKPRTQHAGFVIAPKDVPLNTNLTLIKPDPKDVSLNTVKPDLSVPMHAVKHLKPFNKVFNMNRYLDLYDA